MSDLLGQQLDSYQIERLLGEGGMGSVYQGLDVNLNRKVAVKVMHRHLARQSAFKQRFLQEAQAVARLEHTNIVQVYQFGARDDLLYMVMSFVTGGSLEKYVQDMTGSSQLMSLKDTLTLIAQVADALDYAHKEGIVHRDIKPDNVLLRPITKPDRPGDPKIRAMVTDFGLAKMLEGGMKTGLGTMMGTLPYMSPEQCKGIELDGRSDLYSLGVMLYQLTTGQLPFEIHTPVEAANKHLNEFPLRPRELNPNFPVKVEEIIDKAMAKKPEARFQTGDEMAERLRRVANSLTEQQLVAFAPDQNIYRLATKIESQSHLLPPDSMDTTSPIAAGIDELIIAEVDETVQQILLNKAFYTVGRGLENDIVLQNDDLSRRHVRLQRTGSTWTVTDLGSTNGTFLEGQRLGTNLAAIWPEGATVRIASIHLRWRKGKSIGKAGNHPNDTVIQPKPAVLTTTIQDAIDRPTAPLTDLIDLPIPAETAQESQLFSDVDRFGVALNPNRASVEPGQRVALQIQILNRGRVAEAFNLQVEGLDPEWYTLPQNRLNIQPGRQGVVSMAVLPPRLNTTQPGEHLFQILVTPESTPKNDILVQGMLIVGTFPSFEASLQRERIRHRQKAIVVLTNKGNGDAEFVISSHDPDNRVRMRPGESSVFLPAGTSKMIPIRVISRRRPVFGRWKTIPFTLQAAYGTIGRRLNGELRVPPMIRFWHFLTLLFVLGGIALGLGLGEPFNLVPLDPTIERYIPLPGGEIWIPSINEIRAMLGLPPI